MHSNVVDLSHAPDSSNVITLVISVPEKTQRAFFMTHKTQKFVGRTKQHFTQWNGATQPYFAERTNIQSLQIWYLVKVQIDLPLWRRSLAERKVFTYQ